MDRRPPDTAAAEPVVDPHAITRRRLARLLAIGAVRAATRRPEQRDAQEEPDALAG